MQKQRSNFFFPLSSSFLFLLLACFATAFSPSSKLLGAATSVSAATADNANNMANTDSNENNNNSCESDNNNNNNNTSTGSINGDMLFGKFVIPSASVFCRSARAAAFVNLRPIVPGHVLVVPKTIVSHMADLDTEDYLALWSMVRVVQSALQEAYPDTTAFNVAVQDGRAAGQSVPHVHVHILPRSQGDFEQNDDVYDALEAWAPTEAMAAAKTPTDMAVPDDADRIDRTVQAMADEASMYRRLLEAPE